MVPRSASAVTAPVTPPKRIPRTPAEAAARIGVARTTLPTLGLPCRVLKASAPDKLGRCRRIVRYFDDELDAWLETRRDVQLNNWERYRRRCGK